MTRLRRLRKNPTMRALIRETTLNADDFIQPYFVIEGKNKKHAVESMPGVYRFSVDLLLKEVDTFIQRGGRAVLLFGLPSKKDLRASSAYSSANIVATAVRAVKKNFPKLCVITDVCLCAYMSHGHCGVLDGTEVHNDQTLPLLAKMALSHAEAGADVVAPSDMMDFRVGFIRDALDNQGFTDTAILSYAVKYASAFYGPFRDAANSAPEAGDRKSYQMDPANHKEALREAQQDIMEGADMIMVKPALAYLDIVRMLREATTVPLVAYSVSGEYAMIKSAAQNGWINEQAVVLESLTSMKRAGSDLIITYHATDALTWIR